jgi:hypothetical protein
MAATNEEVLAILQTKAEELGSDSFWARISVKRGFGPVSIGMVDEATVLNFARPEEWLPAWAGGGHFIISVGHSNVPAGTIGLLSYTFKDVSRDQPNDSVFDDPDWKGPRKLLNKKSETQVFEGRSATPFGNKATTVVEGTNVTQQGYQAAIEMERLRFRLEQSERDASRDRAEMKELVKQLAHRPVEAPKPLIDPALIVALAPVVQSYLAENKKAQVEQQKQVQAQQDRMIELFKAFTTAPKTDPMIEKMLSQQSKVIEKLSERSEPDQTEVFAQTSTMMTSMINMVMKATNMAAEARLGDGGGEASPLLMAFREATQAAQAFFMAKAAPQPPAGQKRLAQAPAQPQPAATPAQAPAATPTPSTVDQIVAAIKAKRPVLEVAQVFVKLASEGDPELTKAIEQAGNVQELIVQRLGQWPFQSVNIGYARELLGEIQRLGLESGVFAPDEDEDEETEETPEEVAEAPVEATPANGATQQAATA